MDYRLIALTLPLLLWSGCSSNRGKTGGGPGATDDLAMMLGSTDLANGGCGAATYEAHQAPAAMLVLLDNSSSMAVDGKNGSAVQAIVQALDRDVFDSMSLGLMAAPSGGTPPPACLMNLGFTDPVACGTPASPQVKLAMAGANKSSAATGVRRGISDWLNANPPDANSVGDATPMYAAMRLAIGSLQGWPIAGKRILMVVTDGSWDCTQYSTRHGYPDCNMCDHEWEDPQNVISLVTQANQDPNGSVETFIVGVPGAETYDQSGCMYPQYHMRAALSAVAYAGSPKNVPANCTGKTFSQMTMDPAVSCHFDMTKGNFNAAALAAAISQVRGKVLGCVFDLPAVDGGTIDQNDVNVNYSVNGGAEMPLYRRKDMNNACANDGCWDYNADGKVELIGKACDDVKNSMNAKVKIKVGCPTIIG